MNPQEPYWQQQPRYDGASFDLSHLRPLDRVLLTATGPSVPLQFRFSSHCRTDKPGRRDLGTRITDDARPGAVRYFCPVRWFLSLRRPALAKSLDIHRLDPVPGYQWLLTDTGGPKGRLVCARGWWGGRARNQ